MKKHTYRILALKWGLTSDAREFVSWVTKKELHAQLDALKSAGFNSVVACRID